jgi:hypothetical protein
MKLHEIYPHNKFLFYIGAILLFTGTYLDNTTNAYKIYIWPLLLIGILLMLLGLKKPKGSEQNK